MEEAIWNLVLIKGKGTKNKVCYSKTKTLWVIVLFLIDRVWCVKRGNPHDSSSSLQKPWCLLSIFFSVAFPIEGGTNRFRAQAKGCSAALRKALNAQSFGSAYHSGSHTPSLSFSCDSIFTCFQLSHHLSTQASGAVCCSLSYLRFMSLLPGKNPLVSQSTEHGMLPFYDSVSAT